MERREIEKIVASLIGTYPDAVVRYAIGIGNRVYRVECGEKKYICRCGAAEYRETAALLKMLADVGVPVPSVLGTEKTQDGEMLLLSYIDGEDLGQAYPLLTNEEKRYIAVEVMAIQHKAAQMQISPVEQEWCWENFVRWILSRARERIACNGYFDVERVDRLYGELHRMQNYFSGVEPMPYLDDISTKNLLIHKGRVSGVVDVDWIGRGDDLTFIALTYVALLNMGYDTKYVDYLLEARGCNVAEQQAFLFYSLMYCVDFMGERGMRFGDKVVEVNAGVVVHLENIYETLWDTWSQMFK